MEADVRVIQYLGSKLQILNDIETEIEMLLPEGGIVSDAFSGSGVVAYKLAQKYTVYANDIQEYVKVISDVLLQVKGFTGEQQIIEVNKTTSSLSDVLSADLQKRGMKFVGSTIIYSYLQAIGVISSHEEECFMYKGK